MFDLGKCVNGIWFEGSRKLNVNAIYLQAIGLSILNFRHGRIQVRTYQKMQGNP
jgi:hypothetical protein